jgi:Tol biopolymer transport system component
MAIPPGTTFGSYEVTAQIGAGGMGEVYRAHDTKLGRDVAIKVLPAAFAHDPERLARFQREAKLLAAMNHPNIATIHGLEHADDTHFLVMELVEGETLADRVKSGPVPVEEALKIAVQIAEALEAANEKNIIHRDLKPANVKVTPEVKVKVLDFGLAKAFQSDTANEDMNNSPTLSRAATMQGVILGTAAYMSPEQARGKLVDKQTDIWAFGCTLYEMLTGTPAFHGEDVTEILAAVVKTEPDWNRLPASLPSAMRGLLLRCLRKDKRKRMSDAADIRIEIEDVLSVSPSVESPETAQPAFPVLWAAACGLLLLLMAALAFVHFRETPPAEPVLQLSVALPRNRQLSGFTALSPDGKRVVLELTEKGGKRHLWLRSLNSIQLEPLSDTDQARAPFWSPDSKFIGFFADGKLKVIPASGGPPQIVCEGTGLAGEGSWSRQGVILFSTSGVGEPIQRVNAMGGPCTPVTKPVVDSRQQFPKFLPDGKHFVYSVRLGDESKRGIYVAALDDPTPRRILADDSGAVFASSATGMAYGYLLFLRGNNLMAQPFDAHALQAVGDLFPVATNVSINSDGDVSASVSDTGILAFESNLAVVHQLFWLDRAGKELGKIGEVQDEPGVTLSPDSNSAATVRFAGGTWIGIWIYDLRRGVETRFTSPKLSGSAPVWSPDGKWIAFGAGKSLYLQDAGGGSKEELLFENANSKAPSDWSRDGRYLIYTETDPKGQGDIWYLQDPLNKSADHRPVLFQGTDAVESQGQLSPDGHWLAYVSNASGEYQVYVRPFLSGTGRWKVSASGVNAREPRWRADGKELFFLELSDRNQLMVVTVRATPPGDFQAEAPKPLFEFRGRTMSQPLNIFIYAASGDGQRFLVQVQPDDSEGSLNVITNWEHYAIHSN